MEKYRIHELASAESLEIFGEETFEHGFCLVNKYGEPYITKEYKIPVYMPSAYAGVRVMEAYCYLQAYADANDIPFKEYDAVTLVNDSHTKPVIDTQSTRFAPLHLHSSKVFDGMNFAKPVRKLQSELGGLLLQIKEVEKRLGKLSKLIGKEFEEPEKSKDEKKTEPILEEKSDILPATRKAMQRFKEEYEKNDEYIEEQNMELE